MNIIFSLFFILLIFISAFLFYIWDKKRQNILINKKRLKNEYFKKLKNDYEDALRKKDKTNALKYGRLYYYYIVDNIESTINAEAAIANDLLQMDSKD
jgi:hypothetical protein